MCRGRGLNVGTVSLADVLARPAGPVRMTKLDCEGAEYSILDGVDLSQVQQICGEAHDITLRGRRHGITDLIPSLPSHPFIDHYKNGPTTWLFYAS